MTERIRPWLVGLSLTGAFVLLAVALYTARWILLLVLVGLGLSVLISPVFDWLKRRARLPRGLSAVGAVLVLLALVTGGFWLAATVVTEHLAPLITDLPNRIEALVAWAERAVGRDLGLEGYLRRLNVGAWIERLSAALLQGAQLGVYALGAAIFLVAFSVYLAVSPERYLRGALSLLPAYRRPRAEELLRKAAAVMRQWFVAQFIVVSVVGTLTALGLWLIGVPQWATLGLITAVCEIVPYVGPLFAAALASLFTIGALPDHVPWVLGLYLVIQQLEGNLITPLVLKERIELPPPHLLLLMLLMGHWFGFLGVFVSAPLLAVGRALLLRTHVPRMNRMVEPPRVPLRKSA